MKKEITIGLVFILVGGFIYSIERAASMLSSSMILAGFYAGNMTGETPVIIEGSLFSNPFAIIFLCIGIGLVVYGFRKTTNSNK